MDFRLSEEQQAFADSAAALFADHCSDEALRAHDTGTAPYRQALWRACIELGLHSVLVPEAEGGLGLGLTELMGVLEAQGRSLALVPLWEHQLAVATLARFAEPAGLRADLAEAMNGGLLLTASLRSLADTRGATLRLERRASGGWRLSGSVAALPLGDVADRALLGAAGEGGAPRLLLLDLSQPGVQRFPGRSQQHLGVADLLIEGLDLPDEAVLAEAAHGWFEPRAIACLAALQLGVTAGQLQRTVQYVSERRQFDRPIGSFQLVAGQLADARIALETLRSALWQLVWRLDAGLPALPQALALRAQACDLGHFAGHRAQHVHGGMGVDVTYPIHRCLYWSRALATALGGADDHLTRLGDWLAEHDALGWKYDLPEPGEPAQPAELAEPAQ